VARAWAVLGHCRNIAGAIAGYSCIVVDPTLQALRSTPSMHGAAVHPLVRDLQASGQRDRGRRVLSGFSA
jgi:hypothetical protein